MKVFYIVLLLVVTLLETREPNTFSSTSGYLTGLIESVPHYPLQLVKNADGVQGTIRKGALIPIYVLGEYYLGLCGTMWVQREHMCIQSQAESKFEISKEDTTSMADKIMTLSDDEVPFYGILIARKGDKSRLPLIEIQDIFPDEWDQKNTPYALWVEDGQLFLSIVVIGNGGGSGEGTESVFVLRNGKWELVGCYYFIPDIYGNRGDLNFSYENYTNSVNYISTITKGFGTYPLKKCSDNVKIQTYANYLIVDSISKVHRD